MAGGSSVTFREEINWNLTPISSILQRQNNWNLTPITNYQLFERVIQKNGKTLNSCIIKTAASPFPNDHSLKTSLLRHPQKSPPKRAFHILPTEVGKNQAYLPSAGAAAGASAGALTAGGVSTTAGAATLPPWKCIITGTISSATMLMILIKGLIAGPAVSL